MGNEHRYRDVHMGRGQANLGHGNRNIGRDHIDNRGGRYAGRDHRDERRYTHNHGLYAEGDVHYRGGDNYDIRYGPADPMDGIADGRGVGRVIAALGMLVAFAGFAAFAWVIISAMTSFGPDTDLSTNPFSRELLGVPAVALGFGGMAVGGVIASIGTTMARAARRRHDEALRRRRRRY